MILESNEDFNAPFEMTYSSDIPLSGHRCVGLQ